MSGALSSPATDPSSNRGSAAAVGGGARGAEVRAWLQLLLRVKKTHIDAMIEDGWDDMEGLEMFVVDEDAKDIAGVPEPVAVCVARATCVRIWVREITSPAPVSDPTG